MTKEELIAALKKLQEDDDWEDRHIAADALLLAYIGDDEVTAAYNAMSKWHA